MFFLTVCRQRLQRLLPVFLLQLGLIAGCASKQTSPENWQSFLKSQKRYYNYSHLPISGFECEFSIPALEDSVRKAEELITNSGKYKVEAKYEGKLNFDKKTNTSTIAMPGIQLKKASSTGRSKQNSFDESTRSVSAAVNALASTAQAVISDLMKSMTMPSKDSVYVAESETFEDGSRFVIQEKNAKVSIRNTGYLRTENTRLRNGTESVSTTRYIEVKNGLLPVTKSSSSTNSLVKSLYENQYEFQNIDGWRLPQRNLSNISTFKSGSEVKSNIEINYKNCKVSPLIKTEAPSPKAVPVPTLEPVLQSSPEAAKS